MQFDIDRRRFTITYNPATVSEERIVIAVAKAGDFQVTEWDAVDRLR